MFKVELNPNTWIADDLLPAVQRIRGVIDLAMNVKRDATFPGSRKAALELAVHELMELELVLQRFEAARRQSDRDAVRGVRESQ